MRVAVTGASGFIGGHLVPALRTAGHDVVRLVRRAPSAPDEVSWDPQSGVVDTAALGRVDAAIHLAGAGIGDRRWTTGYKRTVIDSRVEGTSTLARALAAMDPRPAVLVSASGIGYYGETGPTPTDESGPLDDTFAAQVCQQWESAADPAREAGIRVVHPRSAPVIARRGGAYGRLRLVLRTGLGGPLGSGRQYWSWITLEDEIRAMLFALEQARLEGPVNFVAPNPVTNAELMRACARALHRPALVPVPAFALRLVLGEFATELLISQRIVPRKLLDAGFSFTHAEIDEAAKTLA
ncbi:MAG TPA: TIGR01777 family oxidoreductase [Actinomycetes bacterium]|nr:TIGR01777 family oxidoreductase [Actinomycetes bacterium]